MGDGNIEGSVGRGRIEGGKWKNGMYKVEERSVVRQKPQECGKAEGSGRGWKDGA